LGIFTARNARAALLFPPFFSPKNSFQTNPSAKFSLFEMNNSARRNMTAFTVFAQIKIKKFARKFQHLVEPEKLV
jgi:hypothetical protein